MKNFRILFVLILAFSFSVFAQEKVKFEDFKLKSKLMNREMPYRVLLPSNYDKQKDSRFPVVYLLHGLFGHFNLWTEKTKLAEHATKHQLIIVNPEGDNGWYSDSVSVPNDRYETYINEELISEIDKNFRTISDRKSRYMAGLSMGGYGSLKFGLKYPEKFAAVGSFSGALGAASIVSDEKNPMLGKSISNIFGEVNSQTRKDNDVFLLAKNVSADKIKELPFIYIDCGTEDFLFQNNRDFVNILVNKKIPHEFRQLPGKHDWKFWDSQVQEFLQLAEQMSKK
jgi:putative tributyrin esterase